MSNWWAGTAEEERVLAEEMLVVRVAEEVSARIEDTGVVRKDLAERLGVKPAELSQRLSGRRNLTLRTLAAMAHELECEVKVEFEPLRSHAAAKNLKTQHVPGRAARSVRYTSTGVAVRGISGQVSA